jgi:hypothetical protein
MVEQAAKEEKCKKYVIPGHFLSTFFFSGIFIKI